MDHYRSRTDRVVRSREKSMSQPSSPANAVTVTIIAQGDNENTPAEAVHHGLEYARKAGFIEAWSDPVIRAQQMPVGHAFCSVDGLDWKHLYSFIPDSGHGKFWKPVFDEVRAALTSPTQHRPGLMEGAGSTPASDRKDQSLVEEGGSIPPLAATAQASVNLDLLDACKCAAEWLSGWASAEPYISQLETAIARASALSSPDASHD